MNRLRGALTFANVCSFLALAVASTGGAYAANTVFSTDIVNEEVKTPDLDTEAVTSLKLLDGGINSVDLNNGSVTGAKVATGAIGSDEIANETVGSSDIATNGVGATEVSDGSIDSGEIVDNSLFASDLASGSVGSSEIATSAVGSSEVINNSLTAFDLDGGEANGAISLNAGFVANGRCRNFNIAIGGAEPGDAVIASINGALPEGIMLSGVRVPSNGLVTMKACNLSGGAMAAVNDLPVAVVTISI